MKYVWVTCSSVSRVIYLPLLYASTTHTDDPFTNIDQLKAQQVIAFIIKYAIKLRIKSQTPAVEPLMLGN